MQWDHKSDDRCATNPPSKKDLQGMVQQKSCNRYQIDNCDLINS